MLKKSIAACIYVLIMFHFIRTNRRSEVCWHLLLPDDGTNDAEMDRFGYGLKNPSMTRREAKHRLKLTLGGKFFMLEFIRQNWAVIAGVIGALFAGRFVIRLLWARSGRDTNIVNQKGASARGDVVGRDKIVRENKRP